MPANDNAPSPRKPWRGYAFRIAMVCVLAAVILRPGDERVDDLIARVSALGPATYAIGFACIAVALYVHAILRKRRHPEAVFRNEAMLFRAAVATAGSLVYLGIWLRTDGGGDTSLPFLIGGAIYVTAALVARSALMVVFAAATLGGWVGSASGFAPDWGGIPTATGFALLATGLLLLRHRAGRTAEPTRRPR